MPNYDFKTLSPIDFETLSRDLLQEELGLTLQSFTSGRDSGIDFRYSRGDGCNLIVQCKHFIESGYTSLLRTLQNNELSKIRKLSPTRYILTTSVSLTPDNKEKVLNALSPYIRSTDDIYGKDDLNNLLGKFETIERKTIKLWLFSRPALEEVLHASIRNISEAELHRIRERAKLYVQNSSFDQAVKILEVHNFCVIAGPPGIGKTILAEMLVLHYSRAGYEIIKVTHDISEAWTLSGEASKKLFYYDDFLGQSSLTEKLRKNEDQRILNFVHSVSKSSQAKLIMTTREYILKQAYQEYEKLDRERFSDQKCVVDLRQYSRMNRANILYNHLYFSDLSSHYRAALLSERTYLTIIDHRNYSPRIMQLLTEQARLHEINASEYATFFQKSLDNPQLIWKHAFERSLSQAARNLLIVLVTLPHECFEEDLETAYNAYNSGFAQKYSTTIRPQDYRDALKELEGDFLKLDHHKKISQNETKIVVSFTNPSAADYVRQYISKSFDLFKLLVNSIQFYEQLSVIWSWASTREMIARIITRDQNLFSGILRQLLPAPPCRLISTRQGQNEGKKHWKHSLEERIDLVAKIAISTSPSLLAVVQDWISSVDMRIENNEFDRQGLADLVVTFGRIEDPSHRKWIEEKIPSFVDALIEAPADWAEDLRPLCNLVKEQSKLFTRQLIKRITHAVEEVAELVLSDSSDFDADLLRSEAEALKSLSRIVPADIKYAIDQLEELADERSSYDNNEFEYSSVSSSKIKNTSDEEIHSLFSTLVLEGERTE